MVQKSLPQSFTLVFENLFLRSGPYIAIRSQTQDSAPDGSYSYSYDTENGIYAAESGSTKVGPNGPEQVGTQSDCKSFITWFRTLFQNPLVQTCRVMSGLSTISIADSIGDNSAIEKKKKLVQPSALKLET